MKKTINGSSNHLYLDIADKIEKLIAQDVLKIGDKLPSVRVLSDDHGISMGTAFQAYYHLEGRGLIESRPKSGYYVRFNHHKFLELPDQLPTLTLTTHEVSVKDVIELIYSNIGTKDDINFAIAAPDIALTPTAKINKSAIHALRNSPDACTAYASPQGLLELRQQIAKLSLNWGGKIKPDEIVITDGCLEAITIALKAVMNYGDTVAVESPTYFGIYQAMENMGLKVIEIPSDPLHGLCLDSLLKAIKKFAVKACVAVPNFNNPQGSCMSDANKKLLVDIITKENIILIEDDIYGELYFGNKRPSTCKSFDKKGLVIYCASLSKSLAPGYRIGWAIPGKYLEQVKQIKRIQNICSPSLTQATMAHFLKNGRYEYHLKNLRRELYTHCLRYMQAMVTHFPANIKVSRPLGGFTFWIELPKKVNSFKLCMEIKKYGITLMPGKIFSSGTDYSNYIRISFSRPWDNDVDYGILMIGKLIKKMS